MRSRDWLTALAGTVILLSCLGSVRADEQFMVRERINRPAAKVSLDVKDANVTEVIGYIGEKSGRNILVDEGITDTVTLRLVDVPWRRALDLIVQQFRGVIEEDGPDIIRITKPEVINTVFTNAPLLNVIDSIAKLVQASVIIGPQVNGTVNAQLYDVPWTSALNYVVKTNGYVMLKDHSILQIVDPQTLETQLVTRVFQLRYLPPPDL